MESDARNLLVAPGRAFAWFHALSQHRDACCGTFPTYLRLSSERRTLARLDYCCASLEDAMNSSMYTADRTTHLKIVVVALIAATLVAGFGIATTRLNLGTDILTAQSPTVYQPARSVVFTAREGSAIR
jgi:hypothetical protein